VNHSRGPPRLGRSAPTSFPGREPVALGCIFASKIGLLKWTVILDTIRLQSGSLREDDLLLPDRGSDRLTAWVEWGGARSSCASFATFGICVRNLSRAVMVDFQRFRSLETHYPRACQNLWAPDYRQPKPVSYLIPFQGCQHGSKSRQLVRQAQRGTGLSPSLVEPLTASASGLFPLGLSFTLHLPASLTPTGRPRSGIREACQLPGNRYGLAQCDHEAVFFFPPPDRDP